eukprot:PhM_4_TR7471/c0_g1_i1/m.64334
MGTIWSRARSVTYDVIITRMTASWYRSVLMSLPDGAHLLDIGVGTATALLRNKDLILSKKIVVTGFDIDAHYVTSAKKSIEDANLENVVNVFVDNALTFDPSRNTNMKTIRPIPAVYFSGSFMIIPNKSEMLRRLKTVLTAHNRHGDGDGEGSPAPVQLYFTQTFEQDWFLSPLVRFIKPKLCYLLTIDFGEMMRFEDFQKALDDANVKITLRKDLKISPFRRETMVIAE